MNAILAMVPAVDPTPPASVYEALSTATTGVGGQLLLVAGIGLTIGVSLFVLRKGYSLVRSFIH